MKNNILKKELFNFIINNEMNLISIEHSVSGPELSTSDFIVKILSNNDLVHCLTFDYRCKLLSYELSGSVFKFTGDNHDVNAILKKAKDIHKAIVGEKYYK